MFALLCFVLAALASPFKSKCRQKTGIVTLYVNPNCSFGSFEVERASTNRAGLLRENAFTALLRGQSDSHMTGAYEICFWVFEPWAVMLGQPRRVAKVASA